MSPVSIHQDDPSFSVLASGTIKRPVAVIAVRPVSPSSDDDDHAHPSDATRTGNVLDYDSYMSEEGLGRYPSPLKDLALRYLSIPGIINFGGGLPHPSTFPVSSMSLAFPYHRQTVTLHNTHSKLSSSDAPATDPTSDLCLSSMMQYGGSSGSPVLRDFLKEHVHRTGGVGYKDWDLILTNGNTDGLDNIIRLLMRPHSSILLEAYAYPGTLAALAPLRINAVGIEMDSQGLMPSVMDDVLSTWDERVRGTKRPRVVLIVPTGQNPTGATMGVQRRRDLLRVARKWDLIVICDDPYRSLRLHYSTSKPNASPAPPTFASLDADGRVIELCSFSKMVAPGCRLGWILAPSTLITKLSQRNEVTMQSVSGFSVAAMCAFLGAMEGGQVGWERYLLGVAQGYSKRAQLMHRLFQKHLPLDLVSYDLPSGGMFFFLNFSTNHPTFSPTTLSQALFDRFIANLVILTPSTVFRPDGGKNGLAHGEVWFRASFSFAGEEEMEEGARRLGQAVRQVFGRE